MSDEIRDKLVREQLVVQAIPRVVIAILIIAISLVLIHSPMSRLALVLSIMHCLYINRCFIKSLELRESPALPNVLIEVSYSSDVCMYASIALTIASLLNG